MSEACTQCGNELAGDDSCPICLLQLGISHGKAADELHAHIDLPSLEHLQGQFPQLHIKRLVGRGGMGAIYHARQTSLDRDVALKLISRNVADDQAFIERFEREAKTLAKLSHPNIVTVFDFGRTSDGLVYLIMEYVDGINLREAIDTQSVDSEDALEVVSTICGALEYAHSKGVVHRDIKPENILLGEDGILKVADFGIAKIVDDSVRTPALTATRQVLGSLHYLAPEQLEAPQEVDHRVDLYAVGVIFYELLTGQLPLGRYEAPSSLDNHLDRRIDAIVMKTLSRKPKQRYQTASEISSDIQELRSAPEFHSIPEFRSGSEFHRGSAAAGDSNAGKQHSSTSASVPFTSEAYGGFAEVVGVLLAKNGSLQAEFRIRDAFSGVVKSKTHLINIPTEKLTTVDLRPGIFSSKLILVADTISTLGDFPNAETGRVELAIKKSDLSLAASMLEHLGFNCSSPNASFDVAESGIEQRWKTFAVMMFICCVLNVAAILGFTLTIIFEGGPVYAALLPSLFIGPVALLQFFAGLNAFGSRSHLLYQAAAFASLIPLTPIWLVSMPTAAWALQFLRKIRRNSETPSPRQRTANQRPQQSRSWGATTMMFIRESRWSKVIAGLNVAAVVLVAAGFVLHRYGAYPMTLKFRIVDGSVDANALSSALNSRLPNSRIYVSHTSQLLNISTDQQGLGTGPAGTAAASSKVYVTANAVTIYGVEYERDKILQKLQIESPVELVWLASDLQSTSDPSDPTPRLYTAASGIRVDGAAVQTSSPLGPRYSVLDAPLRLQGDLVSQLTGDSKSVSIEFSSKGRGLIEEVAKAPDSFAGLGLVVDGVIEAYAPPGQISGKQATFLVGEKSQVTPDAMIAAIRGPAIPTELELLE